MFSSSTCTEISSSSPLSYQCIGTTTDLQSFYNGFTYGEVLIILILLMFFITYFFVSIKSIIIGNKVEGPLNFKYDKK